MDFLLDEVTQIIGDNDHRYNTEDAQGQLAPITSEFHAEGHASVLQKMKVEPIACHRDLLSEVHVHLDPDLQCLIQKENSEYGEQGFFHEEIVAGINPVRSSLLCSRLREERAPSALS